MSMRRAYRRIICHHLNCFTHGGLFDDVISWYCDIYECCDNKRVPYNLPKLKSMISMRLQGQHIAENVVLNAINSHVKKSKKPLVMSFHGANGVGKTYVSRMIAKAFFKKGENSRFFHFYYGLQNFPNKEKVLEYQTQLKSDIEAALHSCERSLFVFDGVDQMPSQLLDALMPFIDCPNCAGKLDKNKSIFIFLTNTGSSAIEKQLLTKIHDGINRENTTLQDFERLIIDEAHNHSGGLFESLLIDSQAIDFYIPFLPLEKRHVKYCIREAFEEIFETPKLVTPDLVEKVFEELRFGPEPEALFSNSGCKRVAQIAGRLVAMKSTKFDYFNEADNHRTEL
ncbi:torsin-1A-like isoform X1 [Nasonia vitripennis]|uniref:Torsin-1A C-terminal domain-containing protein n=1 Tax=Nasonia vitripennis TaxID=7425 RepID=A0A7M7H133_NASVI|nr:torsin-1A-like isoform X1 [Nasonia vitripennis]